MIEEERVVHRGKEGGSFSCEGAWVPRNHLAGLSGCPEARRALYVTPKANQYSRQTQTFSLDSVAFFALATCVMASSIEIPLVLTRFMASMREASSSEKMLCLS